MKHTKYAAAAVLMGSLLGVHPHPASATTGVTVTRANTSDVIVDGSSRPLSIFYDASAFPANSVITDVNLIVTFEKTDNESSACFSTGGGTYNNEINYHLRSPAGRIVSVIPTGTYSGGGYGGTVVVNLDDSASTVVGGGTPINGTFKPRNPLSAFNGTNPAGSWTVIVGDSAGADILCHYNAELSVTAAPLDNTAPVITPQVTGTTGDNGWYTSDVDLSWTVADPESAISGSNGCGPTHLTSDQPTVEYTCSATSAGGTSAQTVAIKRDGAAPTDITFAGGISDGASYVFGSAPANDMTCSAEDAPAGLASCAVTGYSDQVGTHTLTATATDNAGNTSTSTRSYTVEPWTLNGFYAPVNMGMKNNAKGGSTVPMKFEVFAGSTELTSTDVVSASSQVINCASTTGDAIEQYATGATTLRYDAIAGHFVFNFQTPKKPGTCYRVTMETQDGSKISSDFQLR